MREQLAHHAARVAAVVSPWWRFRLWSVLAGPTAYRSSETGSLVERVIAPHGYRMRLSTADWMERYAVNSGRYYQDDLTCLLQREVKPGQTFVDIGANIGFVTLAAARLVGPTGEVIAVEANPELAQRLEMTLRRNEIHNARVVQAAFGEVDGAARLVKSPHGHGTTFVEPSQASDDTVMLRRGDSVVGAAKGPVFVKIDVEGGEMQVLRGLAGLLSRDDVRFVIEICERHLARFGTCGQAIFDLMASYGYQPYLPKLEPVGRRVRLRPLSRPTGHELYDVMFTRG